jgi:predicted RNA binding protein YcfA (HicA-like mRNA interferase family)
MGNGGQFNDAVEPGAVPIVDLADRVCIYTHMKSREVVKALENDGWREVARKGSHVQFKHPEKPGRVTVPHPTRDIPVGTLRSIEKQSGLKLR